MGKLQSRRSGFNGGSVGIRAFDFDLPFVDTVRAGGKKRLKVRSAEAEVGDLPLGVGMIQFTRPA